MDSEAVINSVRKGLEHADLDATGLTFCKTVTGGIVNQAALYQTTTKNYFVKWNSKSCTKEMFETESESLKLLRSLELFRVPETYTVCKDHTGGGALHILEFIEDLQPLENWSELGRQVASLHTFNSSLLQRTSDQQSNINRATQGRPVEKFGFRTPTYLGNFTPGAVWRDTWVEYFVRDILGGLFSLAETKYGDRDIIAAWSDLQRDIHKLFREEDVQPELLHGDFCPANFGQAGEKTVLFDPSCLYGDPDFDLIISAIETPLSDDFLCAYRNLRPKRPGYEQKMMAYRLFYYLIMWCHVDDDDLKRNTLISMTDIRELIKTMR